MWVKDKEALIFIAYLFTVTVIKGPSKSQLSEMVACEKYFDFWNNCVHCGHLLVMQPIWPSVPHYN